MTTPYGSTPPNRITATRGKTCTIRQAISITPTRLTWPSGWPVVESVYQLKWSQPPVPSGTNRYVTVEWNAETGIQYQLLATPSLGTNNGTDIVWTAVGPIVIGPALLHERCRRHCCAAVLPRPGAVRLATADRANLPPGASWLRRGGRLVLMWVMGETPEGERRHWPGI